MHRQQWQGEHWDHACSWWLTALLVFGAQEGRDAPRMCDHWHSRHMQSTHDEHYVFGCSKCTAGRVGKLPRSDSGRSGVPTVVSSFVCSPTLIPTNPAPLRVQHGNQRTCKAWQTVYVCDASTGVLLRDSGGAHFAQVGQGVLGGADAGLLLGQPIAGP